MKIIKNFITKDEKTCFISEIFDSVIKNFDFPLRFEFMEFYIRDSTYAVYGKEKAALSIDYSNFFVQEMDERAIKTIIRRQLFKIALGTDDDLRINDEMARNGYYDDLFYLYYNLLARQNDFLDVSLKTFKNKDDRKFLMDVAEKCR